MIGRRSIGLTVSGWLLNGSMRMKDKYGHDVAVARFRYLPTGDDYI